ncbi:MAG: rhomboid family intramembrane serine protease [Pseudomonadota bacterium]
MFPIRDHNPSNRIPYVTYALIAMNVAVFLYGLAFITTDAAVSRLYFDYAMIPARIAAGENYGSFVTSIFLHAGFMHIAGNMLFLWIFGDNMEDEMGHVPFLLFYLACGIGASWAQMAADPLSPIPTVGASGAIAGVMGGYILMFPKAKVDILIILIIIFRIIPVPAFIMLGLWFALQLFQSIGSDTSGGGVAYWAHSGGFIIGAILTIPLWLRRGAIAYWHRTDMHPPHPEATYKYVKSNVPVVRRR